MKTRRLRNLEVSAIGMGCMGFTHAYGRAPEENETIHLILKAFEQGCTFFDTAEMHSCGKNEEFLGKVLKELPQNEVVISDKFWPQPLPGQEMPEGKLSEAGIRATLATLESSLRRLQTDYIDLYTEHQMDEYAALTSALDKKKIYGNRDGRDIKKLGILPCNVDR